MNKWILTVAVGTGLAFAGAITFVFLSPNAPAVPAATADSDALVSHLKEVEKNLEKIEKNLNALPPDNRTAAQKPPVNTAKTEPAKPSEQGNTNQTASIPQPPPAAINREELSGLIDEVTKEYKDAEEAERRRQGEQYNKWLAENEKLQEGPYGQYNFEVNDAAKELDLTDAQKEQYYNILKSHDEKMVEYERTHPEPSCSDAEAYRKWHEECSKVDEEDEKDCHERFVQILDEKQRAKLKKAREQGHMETTTTFGR